MLPWLQALAQLLIGFVGLIAGADWLVRGASAIALRFRVRPLVIGLTVVALGTSLPELAVTLLAAIKAEPDISVGNVVGSNISNIALIMGVSALLRPLTTGRRTLQFEFVVAIAVALLFWALVAVDGMVGRGDAALFLLLLVGFIVILLRGGTERGPQAAVDDEVQRLSNSRAWTLVVVGLAFMLIGGHLTVEGGVFVARRFGVPELIIGLTLMALGTSLPELATSVLASRRSAHDLAIGNLIGSNIFNILLILGVSALALPLPVADSVITRHIPVMVGTMVLALALMWRRQRLGRRGGLLLFGSYLLYCAYLVLYVR